MTQCLQTAFSLLLDLLLVLQDFREQVGVQQLQEESGPSDGKSCQLLLSFRETTESFQSQVPSCLRKKGERKSIGLTGAEYLGTWERLTTHFGEILITLRQPCAPVLVAHSSPPWLLDPALGTAAYLRDSLQCYHYFVWHQLCVSSFSTSSDLFRKVMGRSYIAPSIGHEMVIWAVEERLNEETNLTQTIGDLLLEVFLPFSRLVEGC